MAAKVKTTVELSFDEHRALTGLCADLAHDLSVPRVAGAEVFRALLAEAIADPGLYDRIRIRTGGAAA